MNPGLENSTGRFTRARKLAGFCIGALMLAGAVWAVIAQKDPLRHAVEVSTQGRWWLVALAISLPLVNWPLTACVFWLITPRDGGSNARVSRREMLALIGAAGLANYLPLRPGLLGRVTYHRLVNGISITESARVVVVNLALTAMSLFLLVILAWIGLRMKDILGGWLTPLNLATILGCAGSIACLKPNASSGWRHAGALGLRLLDMRVWMWRYEVVFALVGQPITESQSAAIAAVSQAAMLIPVVGNGLGIREWAVGLTAPMLPAWFAGAASQAGSSTGALTADLLNRASEVVVAVPVGLACGAAVQKLLRTHTIRRNENP